MPQSWFLLVSSLLGDNNKNDAWNIKLPCSLALAKCVLNKECYSLSLSPSYRLTPKAKWVGVTKELESRVLVGNLLVVDKHCDRDCASHRFYEHHRDGALGHVAGGCRVYKDHVLCLVQCLGPLHDGSHHQNCPASAAVAPAPLTPVPGKYFVKSHAKRVVLFMHLFFRHSIPRNLPLQTTN